MSVPLVPKTTQDIDAIIAELRREFAPRHHVHSGVDSPKIDMSQIVLPAHGYIRSGQSSYNTGIGFYLGADNGTARFSIGDPANEHLTWDGSTLSLSGSLIAGELHIPDKDTTANSCHIEGDGDTWWGCTQSDFDFDNENSKAYVLNTGSAFFTDVILKTQVYLNGIQAGSEISIQNWQHDLVFSVTDADTVAWAVGTITLMDGSTYSIDAGNTGNMAARTYIYLDKAVSVTVLQTTTTASTAVGSGKILVATAINSTNEALFQVFSGIGGVKLAGGDIENLTIDSAQIAADAITEGKVLADAITAAKINVSGLDGATGSVAANHIIAGMIQTNAITSIKILADAVTAAKINVVGLDGTSGRIVVSDATDADVVTGGINSHATTLITAGKIVISGATNLDDWRKAGDLTMIDGGNISTGTVTATQILADTITANEIGANVITANEILGNTITANEIAANTITAGELNVASLSAISADLGTITAGSISINSGVASISGAGAAVFKSIKVGGSTTQYDLNDDGMFSYGDGSDGALSTTGNVTLSSDKYYTNLTINTGHTFNPNGWRVFVNGTLTEVGTGKIARNGNNGGNGGNGGHRPTVGTGGAGGASLSSGYLKGSVAGADGADGAQGADAGNAGAAASDGDSGTATSNSIGSNGVAAGGAGGNGSSYVSPCGGTYRGSGAASSGGSGGTATASNVKLIANWHLQTLLDIGSTGATVKYDNSGGCGGGGGGGGGSSAAGVDCGSAGCGGGGGGGGSCGGIVAIYAKKIIIGASASIQANGGNGGNGGTGGHGSNTCTGNGGGGCGGAGANGGQIILVYNELTNNGSITVTAGTGGSAGAGGVNGDNSPYDDTLPGGAGSVGGNGTAGTIRYFSLSL